MSQAAHLIAEVNSAGASLAVRGDKLAVRDYDRLPTGLISELQAHKADLMAELAQKGPGCSVEIPPGNQRPATAVTVCRVIDGVHCAGGRLVVEGDTLLVESREPLPNELLESLRAYRQRVMAAVRLEPPPKLPAEVTDPATGLRAYWVPTINDFTDGALDRGLAVFCRDEWPRVCAMPPAERKAEYRCRGRAMARELEKRRTQGPTRGR